MSKKLIIRRQNDGADSLETCQIKPESVLKVDWQGQFYGEGLATVEDFDLLPVITTVVATSAKRVLLVGTNAANAGATKATGGGVKLATAGADDDQENLRGIANTNFEVTLSAIAQPVLRSRVTLGTITAVVASVGLNENPTDPDPSATAGEGASFVFCPYAVKGDLTVDPTSTDYGGITEAQMANWMIHQKVNGADKYFATGVPVVADKDYELAIVVGSNLIAKYYINGALVGTGTTALTSGDKVYVQVGLQALAVAAKNMTCRYISVSRQLG